jgi:hypothetical protein
MRQLSLPGVWQILRRFDLHYKRGRAHVHSPDLAYNQKLALITRARELAVQAPREVVFLYVDEHTLNVRPRVGSTYSPRGATASKATGAAGQTLRLAGALDVASGQVLVRRRERFCVQEFFRFLAWVEQHYAEADIIYVALDNWPVHFHPYVRENLARIHSKIRLLSLPTYAPWTNPIEKFWRKLNREFANQHPFGCDPRRFRDELDLWLDKHREESASLLHEVGLLPDEPALFSD